MNFAHLHLLLNHFPIIGSIIGITLFLVSFIPKHGEPMRKAAYIVFAGIALITIPAFLSGVGAQEIQNQPGVSAAMIDRHEGAAMVSLWFMLVTGGMSIAALWQSYLKGKPSNGTVVAVLVLGLLTVGLMARTGNTGGDIRRPDFRGSYKGDASVGVTESAIGAALAAIEPKPAKFTDAMVGNRWWWAFMMDLHFIGLALLIGTIGIIDLRIMGFARHMPMRAVHRFLPWAVVGLGINVLTGMAAFIGMPTYYVTDAAFWLKMLALMLLGANAALFYLTDVFEKVENLGPGEDAPMTAKLLAASSLFLWVAVTTLGRYLQQFSDSITSSYN